MNLQALDRTRRDNGQTFVLKVLDLGKELRHIHEAAKRICCAPVCSRISQKLRRSGSGRRYDRHGNSANISRARPLIRLQSEVQKSIFKLDSNVYFPPLWGWQSISGSSYGVREFAIPRCLSLANKLQLFVLKTHRFFIGLRTRPQNNQVILQRISLALRSLLKTEGGELFSSEK